MSNKHLGSSFDDFLKEEGLITKYLGIDIDYTRDCLFDELGLARLKDSYMREDETSPQQRYAYVSKQFGSNQEHAQRLYTYASSHWLSYSTPILSFGKSKRGLPISCFLNYLDDSADGLIETWAETNRLSMAGGGVGVHVKLRSSDDKSVGVMPHLKTYDTASLAYRQGQCYSGDTEVLTESGWIPFNELANGIKVGQVNLSGQVEFVMPIELVDENYTGKLVKITNENRGIDYLVTANHSMVIQRKTAKGWGAPQKIRAEELPQHNEARLCLSALPQEMDIIECSAQYALSIAIQADGHLCNSKKGYTQGIEFHLSKQRKIDRLETILEENEQEFTKTLAKDGTTKIYIPMPHVEKDLSFIATSSLSPGEAYGILEEIAEWDSNRNRAGTFTYITTNKTCANKVQELAFIAGRGSRITEVTKEGNRVLQYHVYISNRSFFNLEKISKDFIDVVDYPVFCAEVPSGMLAVRRNGVAMVCGNTRRGSYAMYLDINHPDILQFLELRKTTGDPNIRCQNLHHGINVSDEFMQIIERCMDDPSASDSFSLVDPNSKKVVQIVSAKELWQRILEIRLQTGEPYLHFIDIANRALPSHLRAAGLSIHGSNLCAEIELPTSPERTAVCCLSSLNLDYYDDWKDDYQFIKDVAEMLDNVLQYFIDNCPDELSRARFSAERERSIGVGVLGFHSYLQSKMIPFEGVMAKVINKQIFTNIKGMLDTANDQLGTERGSCPDYVEQIPHCALLPQRFSHTMAVAPTASSSIIMGNTSPSIEPFSANCYRQDTLSGSYFKKNKHLVRVLNEYSINNEDTWRSIASHDGSVQNILGLPEDVREVFKTAMEIDQRWIIELAGDRAALIDQGQSVNVFFRPNCNVQYLHTVHFQAWKKGVKALYYCRSEKLRRADKVSQQIERKIIEELDNGNDCLACSS